MGSEVKKFMAVRGVKYVSESIWLDGKFRKLNLDTKLLFLYLLTSSHVEQAGVYEMPYDVASFETGLTPEQVEASMNVLIELGLIDYDSDTDEVAVLNYLKYNLLNGGANIKKCLMSLSKKISSEKLMESMYNKMLENKDERDIYQFAILCYETYLNFKKTGEFIEIPDEENPYSKEYRKDKKVPVKPKKTKNDDPHVDEELVVIETPNDNVLYWVKKWEIKDMEYKGKKFSFPALGDDRTYKVFTEEQLANVTKLRYW